MPDDRDRRSASLIGGRGDDGKHRARDTDLFAEQSDQDVLGADVVVAELARLLLR